MFIDEPAIDSPESLKNGKTYENFSFEEDESWFIYLIWYN